MFFQSLLEGMVSRLLPSPSSASEVSPSTSSSQDILAAISPPQELKLFERIAKMDLKEFQASCFWNPKDAAIELDILDGNMLAWNTWNEGRRYQQLLAKDRQFKGEYSKAFKVAAMRAEQFTEFLWKQSDTPIVVEPAVAQSLLVEVEPTVPSATSAAMSAKLSPAMFSSAVKPAVISSVVLISSLDSLSGIDAYQKLVESHADKMLAFADNFCKKHRKSEEESLGFVALWDRADDVARKEYIADFNKSMQTSVAEPEKQVSVTSARVQYLRYGGPR